MSQWTYARIDRFESGEVRCVFCNRALRSGRLIVLQDEIGDEAYAGAACAKKHVGAPSLALLDLSKIAMKLIVKEVQADPPRIEDPRPKPSPSTKAASATLEQRDDVAHYILLRFEHMPGFAGCVTERLRDFYAQLHSADGLGEKERLYVVRLLTKAKSANSIYSLSNVERCIGAAYWIGVAIEHTKADRQEFLKGMLRSLREHWRLSAKQIEAVNRWGDGVRRALSDFPKLDPLAFSGVQAPRFSANQNKTS